MKVTTKTDIKEFPLLNRGKVRDIYDIDDSTLRTACPPLTSS